MRGEERRRLTTATCLTTALSARSSAPVATRTRHTSEVLAIPRYRVLHIRNSLTFSCSLIVSQVLNLFRKLGKTIPNIKLPEGTEITNTVTGKKVAVSAPRINFVGGQQLTSMGAAGKSSGPPSLYPPGPGGPTEVVGATGVLGVQVKTEGGEGEVGAQEEAVDVEPVGEFTSIATGIGTEFRCMIMRVSVSHSVCFGLLCR